MKYNISYHIFSWKSQNKRNKNKEKPTIKNLQKSYEVPLANCQNNITKKQARRQWDYILEEEDQLSSDD